MKTTSLGQLTRVEGHGKVELVQEHGRVVDARFSLHEAPRLFEALLLGRSFDEVAEIACRICSICSTVHKVAALQAVEQAIGCKINRQTRLLRELAVNGGQIESHALHLYCLALPDYLGVGGFPEVAQKAPHELQQGLRLKRCGNLIQEIIGGRAIHPFNLIIGGIGKIPDRSALRQLADDLETALQDTAATLELFLTMKNPFPELPQLPLCAIRSENAPLFGTMVQTSAGRLLAADECLSWLAEITAEHTHAKISTFSGTGPFMVGPSARMGLNSPAPEASFSSGSSAKNKNIPENFLDKTASPAFSNLDRAIELQQAVERSLYLVKNLLEHGLEQENPMPATPRQGQATALIEAPRGLLLHHYAFDEQGICTSAGIITPTSINQRAIELSLKAMLKAMDGAGYNEIKKEAERLVRCFDPCISCAVH
jgi:Coenzyme F420-reducing hydrogenase, alpha subunit